MKPIKFPEMNCTYAENQAEYLPLPAYKDDKGEVISCWQLTIKERIKLLFTGKLWLSCLTFNKPLQPLLPMTEYPFTKHEKKKT